MSRQIIFAFAVAAVASLSGCVTAPAATVSVRDPVDALIAASAVAATQALRDLSESTGNSRVVTASAKSPAPLAAAPVVQPSAFTAAPAPVQSTIAGRSGAIAIELHSPTPPPVVISSPSTGVIASGGLLSSPPAGLEKLITVRWTGELEQLLTKVAQEAGWNIGEPTGLRVAPVIISINAESRSAFDVLRDIGAIAGTSADIRVSAPTRTISVRYPQR